MTETATAPSRDRLKPAFAPAAGPALMFFVLWFVATWYYWGDLGKWSDDWSFHVIDPVTGRHRWATILDPTYFGFWRPFHVRTAAALQTLLWRHDWVIHLILAVLHAVNAWLVWRVLLRMCASRLAPAAGALLFMVCPVGYEAVFWLSTIGTGAGLCSFLLCTLAAQRFAAAEIGWRRLLAHVPLLLTIAWWYEQPAAAGPTIALAYLACASASQPLRTRLFRAALFIAAALLAVAIYAAIFLSMAGPNQRGNADSLVNSQNVFPHAALIWQQTVEHLRMDRFAAGAIQHGWSSFWSKPRQAAVTSFVLVIAFFLFGSWWMRGVTGSRDGTAAGADHPLGIAGRTSFQRVAAILYGLGIFAASMSPVLVVSTQWFCSRLGYIPSLGLIIVGAILTDIPLGTVAARTRSWRGRAVRGVAFALLLPSLMCGAVMLVGVQSVWNLRRQRDDRIIDQLRAAVPNPPEHAVFLPVSIRDRLCDTGSLRFDLFQLGPFEGNWSAKSLTQVYHRKDLYGFAFNRWAASGTAINGVIGATSQGMVVQWPLGDVPYPEDELGRRVVPWDRVVAIRIDRHGQLSVVPRIRIEDRQDPAFDFVIDLPALRGASNVRGAPPMIAWRLDSPPINLPAWRAEYPADPPAVPDEFAETRAADRAHRAMVAHPAVSVMVKPDGLSADIEMSTVSRRLAFRVGVMDYIWRRADPLSDGIGVIVRLEGNQKPLARILITPNLLRSSGGWVPVMVDIPPTDRGARLRIQVDPGDAGNANADWCLLTPPVLSPAAAVSAPSAATAVPDTTPPSSPTPP